jgi:PAS domain S-box-containing protein
MAPLQHRSATSKNALIAALVSGSFLSFVEATHAASFEDVATIPLSTAFVLGCTALALALSAVGLVALRQRARRIEATDFLRLTFENMAHGAIVYDGNQRVVAFNQRYIEMLSMPPGSVFIGQNLANILRIQKNNGLHLDIDIESFIAERYDEINRGLARRLEVNLPDGRTLVMRSGAVPGKLHVSSFVEITERKRLERARQDSDSRMRATAAMLDLTFENMAQGAVVFDTDLRVVAFNRRYMELFDLPPEVIFVGQNLADLIRSRYMRGQYPQGIDIESHIVSVYEDLRKADVKVRDNDLPNGSTVAMRSVTLESGLHIATFTDITERRQTELALRESEARIRAILDNAADAIMTITPTGIVRTINPATQSIFGYSEDEVVGLDVRTLMPEGTTIWPPDDIPSFSAETKGRRKNGKLFPLEMSCARTRLGATEVGILILRDVTTQKEMQMQLMHTSKLATVGQMAAGIAHEMNQPLNVVRMAADNVLIRMEKGTVDPAYIQDKLELIGDQAAKVGKMILHMRIFARDDARDLKPFNPADSVRSAIRLMDMRLRLANIRLDMELAESCSPVLGHAQQLEQVIINLLVNAHDAILDHGTPFGSEVGRIMVKLSEDETSDMVVIRVNDTGGGIPANIRDRVFDPFFTTKDVGQGTGLGLSICSTMIAEMKGRIEIIDAAFGTEMVVSLPKYKMDAPIEAAPVRERMQ